MLLNKSMSVCCILAFAAVAFGNGCASIVDGGDKSVRIHSDPPGATVTNSDKGDRLVSVQKTPAVVILRRPHGYFIREDYKLIFEAPGYYPSEAHVKSVLDAWYFGNVVAGGAIGLLGVDPATGAMWTLSPRNVERNLISRDRTLTP